MFRMTLFSRAVLLETWLYLLNMPKALCVTKMLHHAPFLVNWSQTANMQFLVFISSCRSLILISAMDHIGHFIHAP